MCIYLHVVVGSSVGRIMRWNIKSALPSLQVRRQFRTNPKSELVIISRRKKCSDLKCITTGHSFITCPSLFSVAYVFLNFFFLNPTFLSFPFVGGKDCLGYLFIYLFIYFTFCSTQLFLVFLLLVGRTA